MTVAVSIIAVVRVFRIQVEAVHDGHTARRDLDARVEVCRSTGELGRPKSMDVQMRHSAERKQRRK